MNRRHFLQLSSMAGIHYFIGPQTYQDIYFGNRYLMTVNGKISSDKAGITLPHEHITTDFIGAEKVSQPQYKREDAYQLILPFLNQLKQQRVGTLIECTPNYLGRDVRLLKQLSDASGINILTNTGYYAAVDYKYLPRHFYKENVQQIGKRWLQEWKEGINGTGIRPGFIKLGVGKGPLKLIEHKLLKAAAYTHLRSGLKIAVHSGDGIAAREEMEILWKAGVAPTAHIVIHAQNDKSGDIQVELARKGCWISLDGVKNSDASIAQYSTFLKKLKEEKLLHRVLISHDDGWAVNKNSSNGKISLDLFGGVDKLPYSAIFTKLMPELLKGTFTEEDFTTIMVKNPAEAFAVKVCARK